MVGWWWGGQGGVGGRSTYRLTNTLTYTSLYRRARERFHIRKHSLDVAAAGRCDKGVVVCVGWLVERGYVEGYGALRH